MNGPTLQRHIAPIAGRTVLRPSDPAFALPSNAQEIEAFRAERANTGKLQDRKVTTFTSAATLNAAEVSVIASASGTLVPPKGATDPTNRHFNAAMNAVAAEISSLKPDIVVVAGSPVSSAIRDAAKKVGADLKVIPLGNK